MSSTRRAAPDADPAESPERHLASARLRGLGVGLNIVCRVARVLPRAEREAMLWLANYARLADLTAEDIAIELRLPQFEIRESLTNPEHDRTKFVERVGARRSSFNAELERTRPPCEASPFGLVPAFDESLCSIADTAIARKVANGFRMVAARAQIVEVVGPARIGKSIAARRQFLLNLHRAAWLHCPRGGTERDWLNALAGALGMSLSSAQKNGQIIPKIEACLGRNRIELLVVDEAHRLIPVEEDAEPRRLEHLRDLWEMRGVGIVVLATPQYSEGLAGMMAGNPRWAPGQWIGRVQAFHLPAKLTARDLAAVARHHAPEAGEDAIEQLVELAMSDGGTCGSLVATINRALFREEGAALTPTAIAEAHRQVKLAERADTFSASKRGRNGRQTPGRPPGTRVPISGRFRPPDCGSAVSTA